MVTTRTTSYFVIPSASAPSVASTGTRLTSCRVVEAMIGMIIRVSTSEAVSSPWPLYAHDPLKKGRITPRWESAGKTCAPRKGPKTVRPQKPKTTLGIPARSSRKVESGPSSCLGIHSESISTPPTEIGTARTSAINELVMVPMMKVSAP